MSAPKQIAVLNDTGTQDRPWYPPPRRVLSSGTDHLTQRNPTHYRPPPTTQVTVGSQHIGANHGQWHLIRASPTAPWD
jgi:hypothetical protein